MSATDLTYEPTFEDLEPTVNDAQQVVASGGAMQQVRGSYTTAVAVQNPRSLEVVRKRLLAESRLAGELFYYGWGAGDNRIEGPSVKLAMSAARCFGNCAIETLPMQDTPDAWVFTSAFVDLETGFTLTRQFRQSKKWTVYGKHDAERKDDIRFQIGQSKAARNVILNALPEWLIDQAVSEAKAGVRAKIEKLVEAKGFPAAVDMALKALAKAAVPEEAVLAKFDVASRNGLTIEHLVTLKGDLTAIENGQERAETLFPTLAAANGSKVRRSDLNDKIQPQQDPTGAHADLPPDHGKSGPSDNEIVAAAKRAFGKATTIDAARKTYDDARAALPETRRAEIAEAFDATCVKLSEKAEQKSMV